MNAAPALFISHGAPTFALEPGRLGANLRTLASRVPDVKAVSCVCTLAESGVAGNDDRCA